MQTTVAAVDTAANARPCRVGFVTMVAGGGAALTLALKDGSGAGATLWSATIAAGTCQHFLLGGRPRLSFAIGLYLDLTNPGTVTVGWV